MRKLAFSPVRDMASVAVRINKLYRIVLLTSDQVSIFTCSCFSCFVAANSYYQSAPVGLTDRAKSDFHDLIASILDLRLKGWHRRVLRESRVRRMGVMRRINHLTRWLAIAVIRVDPEPRDIERR